MVRRIRCAVFILVSMPLVAMAAQEERQDEGDAVRSRAEWFYGTRGMLDPGVDLEALRLQRMRAAEETVERTKASDQSVLGGVWTAIGPAPIVGVGSPGFPWSGRTTDLTFDPGDPNVLYLSTSCGGLWKTTDGGGSWTVLTATLPSQSIGTMALSPTNPSILWLGTGDESANLGGWVPTIPYFGIGIYQSTDAGSTWQARNGSGATAMPLGLITSISPHPTNPSELLVGGNGIRGGNGSIQGGMWRTTDTGATWTKVFDKNTWSILRDSSNPSLLYAARRGDAVAPANIGVVKSTDGGVTWVSSSSGITATGAKTRLARSASNPQIFYFWDGGPFGGPGALFKSTNGAATWSSMSQSLCQNQCVYNLCLAVDPTDPNTIFAGELGAHESTDGGVTFSGTAVFTHSDHQHVNINPADPTKVYWGTDGGLFSLSGATGTNLNGNLGITQLYDVGIHPTDDKIVLGGAQDNGWVLDSGSLGWTHLPSPGDGMIMIIDPVNPSYCYAGNYPSQTPQIYRSTTGPNGPYSKITGSIVGSAAWVTPYVLDPGDTATIYLGTTSVWRSTDHGTSWANLSPSFGALLRSVAVAPSNRNVVYAASTSKIFRTTDGGTTWLEITSNMGRGTVDIAIDPANPDHVAVVQPIFTGPRFYATTNGGASWASATNGLPAVPATSVLMVPNPYRVYVGTDVGVFASASDAGPFVPDMAGFVQGVPVTDLEYNGSTGTITAATYGRGAWQKRAITGDDVTVGKGPASAASYDSRLHAYRSDGTAISQIDFVAYASGSYGASTAGGDLTGDGVGEIVTGQGPGPTNVPTGRVFTNTGTPLPNGSWAAYGGSGYGCNAATGDLDGDVYDEIVTGPGEGVVYGPQVRGWNYDNAGAVTAIGKINYYAYGTLKYGVNVASGSYDMDTYGEILTGAGPGDVFGPHVRGWNYDNLSITPSAKVSFFAYGTLKYGVNVTAGDVDRDGFDEILTAPGPGSVFAAQVRGWNVDGGSVTSITKINFVAYAAYRYGGNVAGGDVDGDGYAEIVTGPGPDAAASGSLEGFDYDGAAIVQIAAMSVDVWPGLTYGTTVGTGRFGY